TIISWLPTASPISSAIASIQASHWPRISSCPTIFLHRNRAHAEDGGLRPVRCPYNNVGIGRPAGRARQMAVSMTYKAPLADISFALKHGASFSSAIDQGLFGELTMDDVDAILSEAGRFAEQVVAPLNRDGDKYGAAFK